MRSACTVAEIESPLPSASKVEDTDRVALEASGGTRIAAENEAKTGRTWEARLADLAAAPVVVVALAADPVPGLLLRNALVARVDDRGILRDVTTVSALTRATELLPRSGEGEKWKRTVMSAESMGRIWHGSGSGSLSGQYMTHGASGSREMLRTRPPTLRARPEGVSGGYWGGGALVGI